MMITLREHIQNLSKHVVYNEKEILQFLLTENIIVMDEDSLLGYWIYDTPDGKGIFAGWTDGNGDKIWKWVWDIARKNNCVAIYGITRRWKAFKRKYGMLPIKDCGNKGMIVKREVNN